MPSDELIKNFSYTLADEKIARYPLEERDSSKLLVYQNGRISENIYRNIIDYIPHDSLLIFNNTKVIQGRLFFKNSKGAKIEIFCLEPADETSDLFAGLNKKNNVKWKCMAGNAGKWKEKILEHKTPDFTLWAEMIEKTTDGFIVEFRWQPKQFTFKTILDLAGIIPIPPYLKRESEEIDLSRYQTIYASPEGSVAAPTAGLHFTEHIFEKMKSKNIQREDITLHVGAGTFKPMKSNNIHDHKMHAEWMEVNLETIEKLSKAKSKKIIAVGTTSLRYIETLYWMGLKAGENMNSTIKQLEVNQWDAYKLKKGISCNEALESLLNWMKKNHLRRLVCKTRIMIVPSYEFKITRALITNFHQPNSTLLLLVAALTGDRWRDMYQYALDQQFRFLSYGDGSLLFGKILDAE